MSASASKTKSKAKPMRSAVGAPSQHNQSSRKGKRAWRKNVNIEDVEEALEGMREEERVVGKPLQKTTDNSLFFVDVAGDDQVRKSIPKSLASQTTAAKILAQRSAVPAVFSRTTSYGKRKAAVTREEKERMLRIAKRPRQGPFNSIVDPTEFGAGSAVIGLTEAVKNSGQFDPWAADAEEKVEVPEGTECLQKKPVKAPTHSQPRKIIEVPAVVEPHLGTSYNPPADAHRELLLKAHGIEEKRIAEAEKLAEVKHRMENARVGEDDGNSGVPGMKVDIATTVDEEEEPSETFSKPAPERKTKQQRRKAAKVLAEKRALAQRAANKRILATVDRVKALSKEAKINSAKRDAERQQRWLLAETKLKKGLSGQKLGKHKVAEGEVDVQLGEDLSESLRALKPEGNLFRDRFLSLQHRGRIEPRALVVPRKRRTRTVEYEKHAWKKFDRQQ
ncbi:P60-like protein [Guyanagaster necrorhizus]|uniref:Ribosome biogenesis protein NOP53 n=1 Tax=Guyanagaster necrorhizus TaxID=856835 RepID=A0A9P7VQ28_9AGAR|nr:P60-like protein [Guyanagaster necrorhizus MCA 3950]KAG7445321.1 P60-like protein [Guyanagaster necrorhizus MCA 3950]